MEHIDIDSGYAVAGFPPITGYIVKYPSGYYAGAYKHTSNPEQARLYKTEKYALKVIGKEIGEVVRITYK